MDAEHWRPRMTSSIQTEDRDYMEVEFEAVSDEDRSDDGYVSDTMSWHSSIMNNTYENGRRYADIPRYMLPNDNLERDRLDMVHQVFKMTLSGEPCFTKLENPKRILDVGTGTGVWAIEMGDAFQSAHIIGTDISPIQPPWVPPNVHFQIDDVTMPWTFPKNHFDFIHARSLSYSIDDWDKFLEQCYQHLAPGGRLEIAECRTELFWDDDSMTTDSAMSKWLEEFRKLSSKQRWDISPRMPALVSARGFKDVQQRLKVVPIGPWPKDPALKELGRLFLFAFLERTLEAFSLRLFTSAGWAAAEVQVLLALVRQELKRDRPRVYTYIAYTVGTKPKT